MYKTEQKKVNLRGTNGTVINMRKTHRNDPCPCGRQKIITDQFNQKYNKPMKFKNCCLQPYK